MKEFNIKEELVKLVEKSFFDSIETQRVLSDIFVLTEIIISRIKEKELEIKFVFLDEKKSDLSEEYFVKKLDISSISEDFEEKNHEFFERELKNLLADLCKKEKLKALNKINNVPIVYRNLYGKNKEIVQKEYFSREGYEIGDTIFTWIDYSIGTAKLLSQLKNMKKKDLSGVSFDGSLGLKAFADFTDINLEEAILKDVKIIYVILSLTF